MKRCTFVAAFLLTVLSLATMVLALAGEIGKGHDIDQKPEGWPKGLETALKSQEHDGGYWVNPNDCYWFGGDTRALNRFAADTALAKPRTSEA